jgi:hypothetical protein
MPGVLFIRRTDEKEKAASCEAALREKRGWSRSAGAA